MDNKKQDIQEFVAGLFPQLEKHPEENTQNKAFFNHDKHFFIMTEAGKPVYSRFGDEYELSTFLASFSAIIPKVSSFFSTSKSSQSKPNTLKSIKSKKLLSVFKLKGKLVYIAISKVKGETESFLESQIDALHYLMISLLTAQIDARLAQRPGMDLRSQIDGWDSTLAMQIEFAAKSPTYFLQSFQVLRMYSDDRATISNAMKNHKPENCLQVCLTLSLGIMMTSLNVISVVKSKSIDATPGDINLILNYVFSSQQFKIYENWSPICLPGMDDEGFVQVYSNFINPNLGLIFVSAQTDGQVFEQFQQASKEIYAEIGALIPKLTTSTLSMFRYKDLSPINSYIIQNIPLNQYSSVNIAPFGKIESQSLWTLYNWQRLYTRCKSAHDRKYGFVSEQFADVVLACYYLPGDYCVCLELNKHELGEEEHALEVCRQIVKDTRVDENINFIIKYL